MFYDILYEVTLIKTIKQFLLNCAKKTLWKTWQKLNNTPVYSRFIWMNVQKCVYRLIVPTDTFIFIYSLYALLALTKIK